MDAAGAHRHMAQGWLWGLVATTTVLAVVGAALAGPILLGGNSANDIPSRRSFDMREAIPTSFGVISVDTAQILTHRDLVRLGHHNLRHSGGGRRAQLWVAVSLTNLEDGALSYGLGNFDLETAAGTIVDPLSLEGRPTTPLEARSTRKVLLRFDVAARPSSFELLFSDPDASRPITVELARNEVLYSSHDHGGSQ